MANNPALKRTYTVGNPCGVCASGIISSRGGHLVCANCGWYPPGSWTSNTPERGGPSSEGAARADDRGDRATGETGDDRPAAPVSLSSNERLRELLAEWDGLKGCARTDGIGFDVVLTKRALVLEQIVETARKVVSAPETGREPSHLLQRLRDPKLIGHECLREEAALEIELLQDRESRLRGASLRGTEGTCTCPPKLDPAGCMAESCPRVIAHRRALKSEGNPT